MVVVEAMRGVWWDGWAGCGYECKDGADAES